jgi:hypothetical protein
MSNSRSSRYNFAAEEIGLYSKFMSILSSYDESNESILNHLGTMVDLVEDMLKDSREVKSFQNE